MKLTGATSLLLATALPAVAAAQDLPAGRWHHAGEGSELVIESKVKLTPSGSWAGTNLGGSVGYGSMTTTRVVAEPAMRQVARTQTLVLEADGRFDWTIERRITDAKGCVRTVRQHKTGTASRQRAAIVFDVRGGEERGSGCGADTAGAVARGVERYEAAGTAGALTLSGPGGARWRFTR